MNTIQRKKSMLLESIANGSTVTDACIAVNIARGVYYLWTKKDKKFADDVLKAEEKLIHSVEDAGINGARGYYYDEVTVSDKDGKKTITKHIPANPALNIFYICNLLGIKYKNIQRVEHSGKIIEELKLSDEDRKEFRKLAELIVKAKSGIK